MAASPRIQNRIGVQAPAEIVWEVLFDFDHWPDWNPIYSKTAGKIGYDQKLELTLALPDLPPRDFTAVVTEWIPNDQLIWTEKHKGGWISSQRYFEIDTLTEAACIFSNGELFEGVLVARAVRPIGRALFNGFEAFGEAMKARAEALWRERSGGA